VQIDLRQILNGLRKRWWLVVITTLAAAAVAYIYSAMQPSVYQAQATLVAAPVPLDNGQIEAIKKTLPTYAQQLGSVEFWRSVIDHEGIQDVDPKGLVGKINVQARPDSNSLVMTVDSGDADKAATLADRIANAFVDQRNADNQDVNPGGFRTVWTITQAPAKPDSPYQPRPKLYAAAAALFGLLLGLLLAIALELLDTTLKSSNDVEQYLGLNTVGIIPKGN
jgi:capsular polysaccharide biosynthesis protein